MDKNGCERPEYKKYYKALMKRERIVEKLREKGCRITKQRMILLDIILEQDCASCKEIIYRAARQGKKVGPATVYRMVNVLEEIGAIRRGITYREL